MKTTPLLLAAALLLLPCAAGADPLRAGALELETAVAFEHSSFSATDDTYAFFDGSTGLAYGLTDMFQVGGGLLYRSSLYTPDGGEEISSRSYGASVDVTANFRAPSGIVPFVRVGVGFRGYDDDLFDDPLTDAIEEPSTSVLFPMVRAGVRLFVGDAGSVNLSLSYRRETNADGVEGDDANRLGFALGLSLFPVRGR